MGFLEPLALSFAALSIPVLVLYMLRLRRRTVLISSTLLWRRLVRSREANRPWQRLRRNLLLLLQLLILALLTVGLARPFLTADAVTSGSVVILLDTSASMQATDGAPTRFDAARRIAREIVSTLAPGDMATIIAVGPRPAVLAAAKDDRSALLRALDEAVPSDGPADWQAAVSLAAASLAGAERHQAVIISDGAIPHPLPPLPGKARFVGVGEREDNLAIVALSVREGGRGPQAFLRVHDFGTAEAQVEVQVRTDGALFDVRHLTVPARGSASVTLDDLPFDLAVLEARLAVEDPLPLDDVAWATRGSSAARRVLLVSPSNIFLQRALEMLPGVELTRLAPDQPHPSDPFDLVVYDGVATDTLPSGPAWVLGPYAGLSGVFTDTAIVRTEEDPLLQHVNLGDVQILRAFAIEPPPGARVLVEAEGGPLLFVVEQPQGRLAVLTFALRESDLPLRVAFPILAANLTGWLLPPGGMEGNATVQPGGTVPVQPLPETQEVVVVTPGGSRRVFATGETQPLFAATDRLGVYQVLQFGPDEALLRSDLFAVNLFQWDESDIAPREGIQVGRVRLEAASRGEKGRREFWPWPVAVALGVLGAEWWVFHRGTRVEREWR